MNHLRELEESITSGMVEVEEGLLTDEQEKFLISEFSKKASRAVCFYSDIETLEPLKPISDLCKDLPFETCWFEFGFASHAMTVGVLAESCENKDIGLLVFRKYSRKWLFIGAVATDGKLLKGTLARQIAEHLGMFAQNIFSMVRTFITAMRCNNVGAVEHVPSEKLQASRARRKKNPLFSYWTLELKQSRTDKSALGGTHASPALHLRRGHPREYAPGKWTWVSPCAVGKADDGIVDKDYLLRP